MELKHYSNITNEITLMNNVITCLSDSYSASRRETYESIVNYISYFKQLESHFQQLQNHLCGWYFKSLVTVVPLTDNKAKKK